MLCGSYFVVLCFSEYAEFPKLGIEVGHILYYALFDGTEVVVFEFLSLGRGGSEESTTCENQILSLFVYRLVNKEVFLLGAYGSDDSACVFAEELKNTASLVGQIFHRFEKRGLFIEYFTRIRYESRRNAESIILDESVRSGVPRGVTSRFESCSYTAGGERGSVGFALDKFLTAEFHNNLTVVGRLDKSVVLFCGDTRHRLEPVRKVCAALLDCPVLHCVSDDGSAREGNGVAVFNAGFEFFVSVLRKSLLHNRVVEHQTAENL